MIMYVLVVEGPCTGPPAVAVFTQEKLADQVAKDPWGSLGWCTTQSYRVECAEVSGAYASGQPVFAAHRHVEGAASSAWEVYRFAGLYAAFEEAEKAAGDLGVVREIDPDAYAD
jgi:hypothetical protein